jgi:hypothetical protein
MVSAQAETSTYAIQEIVKEVGSQRKRRMHPPAWQNLEATDGLDDFSDDFSDLKLRLGEIKEKCGSSVQKRPDKVDLVITWKFYAGDESLKLEMRSLEKYGLLDFVNDVYILVDSGDVQNVDRMRFNNTKFHIFTPEDVTGADEWCDWEYPQSRSSVFNDVPPAWCALHKYVQLPNISEFVIQIPDDDLLVNDFSMDMLFDNVTSKPYAWSHGTWGCGQCLGEQSTAALHGPNFLNTCVMRHVTELLSEEWYAPRAGNVFTKTEMMDAVCIALHAMKDADMLAGFFQYQGTPAAQLGQKPLFSECHTNGGCSSPENFQRDAAFWNVQGPGVSAEFPEDNLTHDRFFNWFDENYPEPSRFERGVNLLLEQGEPATVPGASIFLEQKGGAEDGTSMPYMVPDALE